MKNPAGSVYQTGYSSIRGFLLFTYTQSKYYSTGLISPADSGR